MLTIPLTILEYPELDGLTSLINSREFITNIAQHIVQHFEARQKNWMGKGVVVVPDRTTAVALSKEMVTLKPNWHGETEFIGSVKPISTIESPAQREILVERFRDRDDSLSLLIATGSFVVGFDNPLIHTIYVTGPIPLQLRYRLVSLVSGRYQDKKEGLIVDYIGLDWGLQ